jgi:hypothetical protein
MQNRNQQHSFFKTLIYEEELDHVSGWVEEYPDLETGGDLFGFWTHSGRPVVQFVLGPGKASRHNPTSFYQDRLHLIKAGEILREKHGLQHIGEWHSHHQMGLAQPSGGDEQTVFNALRTYSFPRFLLCIANLRPDSQNFRSSKYKVNFGCFLFTQSYPHYQTGSWVVLPEQSPIRRGLERSDSECKILFNSPVLKKNWQIEQTTLEEQPLVTTEPIEISQNIWYSTFQGKTLLKEILEELGRKYQHIEMFRTSSEEVYITFEIKRKNSAIKDKWRIEFPNKFPKLSPLVQINNSKQCEVKNWKGESSIPEQILSCIQRYYQGEWSN